MLCQELVAVVPTPFPLKIPDEIPLQSLYLVVETTPLYGIGSVCFTIIIHVYFIFMLVASINGDQVTLLHCYSCNRLLVVQELSMLKSLVGSRDDETSSSGSFACENCLLWFVVGSLWLDWTLLRRERRSGLRSCGRWAVGSRFLRINVLAPRSGCRKSISGSSFGVYAV
ncbi:hypothetical protein TorRG33x02_307540 [Trema orientale]|uniref:Uncharacterized protein n=1 Tax=Trema orientale TaxID=63057 RepID=A0A2P5BV93_TREOI|nr:hypothetical protein TorRG33x02_307540 [Trema orientale]